MTGKKILVFLGSVRPGRMADRVSAAVKKVICAQGMEPIILDPLENPFEVCKVPLHYMDDESNAPRWMLKANNKIKLAEGFIAISAEYNAGIPPALSNMLDHFPPASFRHRPCGIITYAVSPFGGIRASVALRPFLAELGMFTVPSYSYIPVVGDNVGADGSLKSDKIVDSLTRVVKEVGWYAEAVKKHKEDSPLPS